MMTRKPLDLTVHRSQRGATRRLILAALAAASSLAVAAPAAAQSQPVHGGTLNFVFKYEPPTLVGINNSGVTQTTAKLFDGLLTYDFDLTPKASLAVSWSMAPDGLSYLFKLRDGVKWHDGKPFTSADVAFTIDRLKRGHPRGRTTFANVTDVKTPDPLTVEIALSKPAPYLITALGPTESPIVPKHIYESLDIAAPPTDQHFVGTGPFVFKQWVRGSHAVFERNPNYWDKPKPYLDRIVTRFMTDASARAAAFEAGDLDLGGMTPTPLADLERYKNHPRVAFSAQAFAYAGAHNQLFFNLDTPVLKDVRVRKAIAHAIDLKALVENVFYGYAIPALSPIGAPLKKYSDPSVKGHAFDLALANKLLDEAGHPRGANGMRFPLRLLYNPFLDPRMADFVRASLRRVGIDATIQSFDFAGYVKAAYTDRAFDVTLEALANVFDPSIGVQRIYWSKNFRIGLPFSNAPHYVNPEVDRLLESALVEPNEAKRVELFHAFQKIIHQDVPSVDLVSPLETVVYNKKLKNFAPDAEGTGANFADVYFEK